MFEIIIYVYEKIFYTKVLVFTTLYNSVFTFFKKSNFLTYSIQEFGYPESGFDKPGITATFKCIHSSMCPIERTNTHMTIVTEIG